MKGNRPTFALPPRDIFSLPLPIPSSRLLPKVLLRSAPGEVARGVSGLVLTAAVGFQHASGLLQVLWPPITAPPSGVAARLSGRPLSSSLTSHQIKG